MRMRSRSMGLVFAAAVAAFATTAVVPAFAQGPAVEIGTVDIGGVVRSPNGPEAAAWVIAETLELDVRSIKIVVTDDQGRYVIPDLPKANFDI